MKVENPFDQKRGYQFGLNIEGKIKPLHNSIIVRDMSFESRQLASGIVLLGDDGKTDGIRPRWARVYAIGPEQHDVVVVNGCLLNTEDGVEVLKYLRMMKKSLYVELILKQLFSFQIPNLKI